jgi:hypothetical protein
LIVAALVLILLLVGSAGRSDAQPTALTVDPAQPGREFALGAVGLSLETEELATGDLSARHQSLVALMRMLGPGVLRFGGNSVDRSWWTNDSEAPPVWATSVITPADLTALRGLLVATNWRVIVGVDLGHFDPTRAANEAHIAKDILGSRLLGLEIGNEPDDYGDPRVELRSRAYSINNYLEELTAYRAAMEGSAPGVRLYGPDLSSKAWLLTIASDANAPFDVLTQHYYPISYSVTKGACKGTPVPTARELLAPQVREQENTALQEIVREGEIAHRETRISETNDTGSCDVAGGPATSPVFASALWSLDWALRAASAGVAGLNFHGYIGRCFPNTFSPICAPSDADETRGQVVARPEYYGLLAARQLEGGRFVPVHITGQRTGDELTAYATRHPYGVITLAIDNFAAGGWTSLVLRVPGYEKASGERLEGPSISATSGVTFGHGSINATGALRSTGSRIPEVNHVFHVELAPASAIIVTLQKSPG